ncbi:acyl carrier protein [Streptomyces sp. NPDC056373]|uniref:acyl carrier protein n=1 Tax=Streptomyces sp. NPDC056373 TaxID=3345798 RepID=UPI0035DCC7C4
MTAMNGNTAVGSAALTDDTTTSVRAWITEKLAAISIPPCPAEEVDDSQSLTEDLGVDSLAFIETLVAFEAEFGVRLDEERLLLFSYDTVGDLADHLTRTCARS